MTAVPISERVDHALRHKGDLFAQSGATISPCGIYRYRLWRRWGEGRSCVFVMLNPSTADALVDDNTIRSCVRLAQELGFGGIIVVNLFALRSWQRQIAAPA